MTKLPGGQTSFKDHSVNRDFIMDTWYNELGSVKDMAGNQTGNEGNRQNSRDDLLKGGKGYVVYRSDTINDARSRARS